MHYAKTQYEYIKRRIVQYFPTHWTNPLGDTPLSGGIGSTEDRILYERRHRENKQRQVVPSLKLR
jgi:hypothetical protein